MGMTLSIFLTLREWLIILYLASLFLSVLKNVTEIGEYIRVAMLFFILQICFIALAFIFTASVYKKYRYSGGLKGKRFGANKFLDKIGDTISTIGKKAQDAMNGPQVPQ